MTSAIQINPKTQLRRLVVGLILVIAAALALPAIGQAKPVKFGADLSYNPVPEATAQPCQAYPGDPCTRVPDYYYSPSAIGGNQFAPQKGTITKIKLISAVPGSFRVQMIRGENGEAPYSGKVQSQGPKITYQGTGQVETFDVNTPVKKGQYLGLQTRYLGAVHCFQSIYSYESQFQGPLELGDPFRQANSYATCTPLVQAVIK